jgi:cytochrome c peroxidase
MKRTGVLLFVCIITLNFKPSNTATPYLFPKLNYFPKMPVSADNPVTVEGADLGRHLFYDPILSTDSDMSCSSCHKQKYAFSDSPERFSKGRNGTVMKRNTMALFNLAWYPAYFWDGRAGTIELQILQPVRAHNEMNLSWIEASLRLSRNPYYKQRFEEVFGNWKIDSLEITKAIAQFLRTLISNQSKYDRIISGNGTFTDDEYAGLILINDQTKGDCLHCHTTDGDALGTTLKFSNNGLDSIYDSKNYMDKGRGVVTGKETDNGKFIIPSLRNVALTAPYMHDGRFKSLEDVLDFYSTGVHVSANVDSKMDFAYKGGAKLTGNEKHQIIAFLNTLTDSVFISNPEFSNPFDRK